MKQVLQNLTNGKIFVEDLPIPKVTPYGVLVKTSVSLISAGTERMLLNFGRASWLGKVKQQPKKAKEVLDKVSTDGLLATYDAVKSKLTQPLELGYCNVGKVISLGEYCEGFKVGDRVVTNGSHAEYVVVPHRLCAKIPDNVSDEAASFAVLGAIALNGIRLSRPTLGEKYVVSGLGLLGLLAVQLLRAHGCEVLALDFSKERLALAERFGAKVVNLSETDPLIAARIYSNERGVDAVLITASAKDAGPLQQAAAMCRKHGRIVLIGVVEIAFDREALYEKELSFQVACSYGPGRYDPAYEEKGLDYPIGFVRWTEQRNFEAVLQLMSSGLLDVGSLISKKYPIQCAEEAYDLLYQNSASTLGVLLEFTSESVCASNQYRILLPVKNKVEKGDLVVGFLGAGNYGSRVLMPAFKKAGVKIKTIVTRQGLSAVIHGKQQGASVASTLVEDLYQDSDIQAVAIVTRHVTHAPQAIAALQSGKHVFVEKPLAITFEQLEQVSNAILEYQKKNKPMPILMVGFNRRFSPFIQKAKSLLSRLGNNVPMALVYTVNAGKLPDNHWHYDELVGGGRIVSEVCHFIDLLLYLVDSRIVDVSAYAVPHNKEIVTISIQFENGSIGTVHYFANGHRRVSKERLEIFVEQKTIQLDNFRVMKAYGFSGFRKMRSLRQNKGQLNCVKAFLASIKSGRPPIAYEDFLSVARACLTVRDSLG